MGTQAPAELAQELRSIGLAAGLDAVGVARAAPFERTRRHLEERRAAGLHGGMAFTYRNPARSTEPNRILNGCRSLVVGARRYPATPAAPVDPARPRGVVARYASSDHYRPLRQALGAIAVRLQEEGWQARVVSDDNALVDREAAQQAGLGWYGKNTNLLLPGKGSWFVLGSVVTDAPLPVTRDPVPDGCGACRRCLPACPTGALVAPGVLDARRCLAWLLQAPGSFPPEYRVALGGRLYGCDDCQEACPENRITGAIGPSSEPAGTGVRQGIDLLWLLQAGDDELLATLGRWYIPHRHPRYLRRNALVALGNTADGRTPEVEEALRRCLASSDLVVRAHAVWAAARLGRHDLLAVVDDAGDAEVRRELDGAAADLTNGPGRCEAEPWRGA